MNEEELRNFMQSGFEKLRPHIEGISIAMMECYQQGFKDCWKVLTIAMMECYQQGFKDCWKVLTGKDF